MLVDLLLYLLYAIATVFIAMLPPASWLPLPAGLTNAIAAFGEFIGNAAAFLPDGTLTNMVAALTVIGTVNLLVIPWLAARNFRLPFAGAAKG